MVEKSFKAKPTDSSSSREEVAPESRTVHGLTNPCWQCGHIKRVYPFRHKYVCKPCIAQVQKEDIFRALYAVQDQMAALERSSKDEVYDRFLREGWVNLDDLTSEGLRKLLPRLEKILPGLVHLPSLTVEEARKLLKVTPSDEDRRHRSDELLERDKLDRYHQPRAKEGA